VSVTTITFSHETRRGLVELVSVGAVYVVCPVCHGKGTTVNPSVDGNGLTSDDFAEDPDFLEHYMAGVYDVSCRKCGGKRVVAEVDEASLSRRERVLWSAHVKAKQEERAQERIGGE
jgi:hypothetical protein